MTAIVYSEDYQKHETGNHPENKERTEVIIKAIKEMDAGQNGIFEPEMAGEDDLLRVHSPEHVAKIKAFCQQGGGYLDFDTMASSQTYQIAKLSAGGAIKAAKLVLEGEKSAYSIGRPPGHHATRDRAMGFCFFNNLAVVLKYLREVYNIKKFFIFDFDVHYGNGTAEIFYEDPQVLYISIHQDPRTIFPGSGFIEEIGRGEAEGRNLNIPLPPGSNTSDYIYILENILKPVAEKFKADFYLVDVGFDGHQDDPLSSINLNDDFYQWVAMEMMEITPSLALILEGGYDLPALYRCNQKLINGLNANINFKDRNIKENKSNLKQRNQKVHRETKDLLNEIKKIFSPFYEF